jgi:hypothetical protein
MPELCLLLLRVFSALLWIQIGCECALAFGLQAAPLTSYVLPGRPHRLSVALPRAACGPLGALQELSSAATSLLFSYSVVAFFRCCVLSTTAFLLLSSYPLPLRVVCEISLVCPFARPSSSHS